MNTLTLFCNKIWNNPSIILTTLEWKVQNLTKNVHIILHIFQIKSQMFFLKVCYWINESVENHINTGQSIPIPHSGPFSHLRCGNGYKT